MRSGILKSLLAVPLLLPAIAGAAETRPWQIYLLFGQSNMAGGARAEAQDVFDNPRVKVLAYDNCSGEGRTYNQWYTAKPSLHLCNTGMGLGDWFGKVVADSLQQDTIALIPCAIPGVDIDFFRKNVVSSRRNEFRIPPDNHWSGAYPWMIERLKKAREKGEIQGILFHQGEADWTSDARKAWVGKVSEIVTDLKKDLGFGDVPFLAGELRADSKACCGAHNPYVATLAQTVPNGHVVSSANLAISTDAYHFTATGYREFGKRYAAALLQNIDIPTRATRESPGTSTGWRLDRLSDGHALAFDVPQDRILVVDSKGRTVGEGRGESVRISSRRGPGLLFFLARSGTTSIRGTLPGLP
ncbi:MAG: hypothetical protein H6686_04515 [Fibrobacteria bacterium]|nr:hypothetical protein [Fibrobacteria bacterium]